jgi:hypothetical protein
LLQVKEMGQHMLGQVGEHVGVTVEVVVSLPTVAVAYHHTQAAASHNRLENKVKSKLEFQMCIGQQSTSDCYPVIYYLYTNIFMGKPKYFGTQQTV